MHPKTCFFKRHLKVEISLAFLTYVSNEFQSFSAKNENDQWRHSRLKLGNVKSVPNPLKLQLQILILKISSIYPGASLWIHLYTKTRAWNFLLFSSVLLPAIFNKLLYDMYLSHTLK